MHTSRRQATVIVTLEIGKMPAGNVVQCKEEDELQGGAGPLVSSSTVYHLPHHIALGNICEHYGWVNKTPGVSVKFVRIQEDSSYLPFTVINYMIMQSRFLPRIAYRDFAYMQHMKC